MPLWHTGDAAPIICPPAACRYSGRARRKQARAPHVRLSSRPRGARRPVSV